MAFRRVLLNGTNVEDVKQTLEDYFSTKLYKSNYPNIKHKIIVSPTKNDTLVIDLNGDGADTVSKKVKDIGIKYKMTAKIKNEKPMSSVKESTTIKKSELTQLIKEEIKNVLNESKEEDRYKRPIVTNKQGEKFILQGFLTSGYYLIPYDGSKYWEPSSVSKNKWIPEKSINWDDYNFTKQQFEKLKVSHSESEKETNRKFQDMNESKEETNSVIVTWVDRDYKEYSKVFKNDPKGVPDNAKKKAETFKKSLEDKDKKSQYGLYRNIKLSYK
jgi:hypothetical protein